jgi:signal peptidase
MPVPDPSDEDGPPDELPVERSSSAKRRRKAQARQQPVRTWRSPTAAAAEEQGGSGTSDTSEDERAHRRWRSDRAKRPVFWRARDSIYFEPLVALAIVVLLLVSLWAYTGNWPPIYVVESKSMQHGPGDELGLINPGDLVLAKKASPSDITTYYEGLRTGYSTYGEYGDVILYYPNGLSGGTPIIHRALLFLNYDPTTHGFSIPDLVGLPCGTQSGALYTVSQPSSGCLTNATSEAKGTLSLFHVGWMSVNVSVNLGAVEGHSGYLTMGDGNFADGTGIPDEPTLSALVEPGWVIGTARGMVPWFGALKLLLGGDAGNVSSQSWEFLGVTIVGLLLLAFGIHYLFRAGGIQDERRKRKEDEAEEENEEEEPPAAEAGSRGIRRWRHPSEEPEEDDETDEPSRRHWFSRSPKPRSETSGRPRPKVQRDDRPRKARKKAKRSDGDESDR